MLLKMVESLLFLEAGAGAKDGAGETKTGAGQKRLRNTAHHTRHVSELILSLFLRLKLRRTE